MSLKARRGGARASSVDSLRGFARHARAIETLESRRLLAAYIAGSSTPYATIQAAVNAAAIGATINVEPGTYSEQVTVSKRLTIRGAKAGIDGRSNARADRAGESVVNGVLNTTNNTRSTSFYLNADNIILDGFIIEGHSSTTGYGAAVHMSASRVGIQVLNNIVQNNATGVHMSNNSATAPLVIRGNVFRNNNVTGPHSGRGLYTDGSITGGVLQNVLIDNNAFVGNKGFDPNFQVQPAIGFEALLQSTVQTNIRITNNIFDNNGKHLLAFNASNMTITGNWFQEAWDTTSAGIRLEGGMRDVTIRYNNIYGSGARGLRIDRKASSGSNYNFTITNNNFFRNGQDGGAENAAILTGESSTTSTQVVLDGTVNVAGNWWNSTTGPGGDWGTPLGGGDDIWTRNAGNRAWITGAASYATAPVVERQGAWWGTPSVTGFNIQFEDHDHGGSGVAYSDTTSGNSTDGLHHYENVDIQTTTDTGGGFAVGNVKAGEWLEYTISVAAAGTYTFQSRVASAVTGGNYHLELNGTNISGTISVPNTGGASTWTTTSKTGINLPAGVHILRIAFDSNPSGGSTGNFNWFKFVPTSVAQPPNAPTNLAAQAPTPTKVTLTWTDNAIDETSYVIERKTGAAGTWAQIATTGANASTHDDLTVSAGTTYVYRVRAANSNGQSNNSNESSVLTPVPGLTYLSDLEWSGAPTNGWGPVEKDMAVGGNAAGDGPALTLNGVTYAKGLGTHAPAEIIYQLNGQYTNFVSDIGIDDRQTSGGTVVFQVWADGVLSYQSPVMTATSATITVNVPLAGVQQLKLVVTDAGDGTGFDHADWAGARLLSATGPGAPSGLAASAASHSQINLTWTDNATDETGFVIERSLNGADGWTAIGNAPANATSYNDAAGLSAGTKYHYRVRANGSSANSGWSNIANATTQSVPVAPNAPTNLVATGASHTQVNLTWTDNSNNETGFILERSPNGVDGWVQIATPTQNATAYNDTSGISPSTQYFYRIRATNSVGPSADSNIAAATTAAEPQLPAAPTGLAASAASASQINLTWTDASTDETGFKIERSLNGIDGWVAVATTLANATTYSNTTGLTPGTTYHYRVRATNSVGDSANSNVANATTFASSAATFIPLGSTWKFLDNGSNQGTAWTAAGFNDAAWKSGAAEIGYGDGDEATVASFGASSTAKFITTYFRKSFTIDNPSLVTALSLRLKRDDGAVVYLNGAEVYRSNMPTGPVTYTTRAATSVEDNTFFTSSINPALLTAGNNVIAVEIHQDSPSSSDISFNFELTGTVQQASTPPAAPSGLAASAASASQINLTWLDNAANESGFKIERSPNGIDGWQQIGTAAQNATGYSDGTGLSAATTYHYRVRATNAAGDSASSNNASATTQAAPTVPTAPTGLAASATSASQINLTWTDTSNDETGFIVERSLNGIDGWTRIATPAQNATSYSNTGLSASTTYHYRVRATNAAGPSADSNVASATTQAAPVGLPAPWTSGNVGTVPIAGSATHDGNGTFTVTGSGDDIWGTSDQFRFVYQSWTGNGQIIVRVASMTNTNAGAEAGVMIRESLANNAKHATLVVTPGAGIGFVRRTAVGGTSSVSVAAGQVAPHYLKLIRNGTSLSAYRSTDGTTWSQVGAAATVSMTSSVFIGMVVNSHNAAAANTSTFDSVLVSASTSSTLAAPTQPAAMASLSAPTASRASTFNTTTLIDASELVDSAA